jgi:hypothetical protein
MFLHVQNTQTSKVDSPWFLGFITHLHTFGSKMLLTFKIMNFKNVVLTKVVHIYVIKAM